MHPPPHLLALAGFSLLVADAAAARAATCSFSTGVVTVQLTAGEAASIRNTGGVLTVNGASCAPTADIVQADVLGPDGSNERVTIRLAGFAEAAAIQWSIALGTGKTDTVSVIGTAAADRIRAGTFADGSHGVELDANGETDMRLVGVEYLVLDGGRGDDRLRGTLAPVAGAAPFAGHLNLWGRDGNDILVGGDGRDDISGGGGQDDISGGEGNDELSDGAGDDVVDGGGGDDLVYCDAGNDTYLGGSGSDLFISGSAPTIDESDGDDLIDGGPGQDRIQYYRSSDLTVDLLQGIGGQAGESDTLVSIWGVIGGSGNDTLIGDGLPNQLSGSEGDDTLRGGGGIDTLFCGPGFDSWSDAQDTATDCENPL